MSENKISNIKIGDTTYAINDSSKASIESVLEFGEVTSENNSLLISTNSKLDELLNRINGSIKSQDFYKCVSVNTSAKTWSGYKAILTNGVYSFDENEVWNLTYSSVTPELHKIYTADALVQIFSLYFGESVLISPINLTSNVSNPAWEVIADSRFSDSYPEWKAFDGKPGGYLDGWLSAETSGAHWIGLRHIGSPVTIIAYGFYPAWSSSNNAPAKWELQGSDNGSDWVTLDVNSKIIDKESKENRFELSSPATFEYFRLYITRGQASSTLYVAVGELLLYGLTLPGTGDSGSSTKVYKYTVTGFSGNAEMANGNYYVVDGMSSYVKNEMGVVSIVSDGSENCKPVFKHDVIDNILMIWYTGLSCYAILEFEDDNPTDGSKMTQFLCEIQATDPDNLVGTFISGESFVKVEKYI